MQAITKQIVEQDHYFIYIYTPFCGTCHFASHMLREIEAIHGQTLFYEMNASLYPEFMQTYRIESVPCLLIKKDGKIVEKVYVFHSVPNIYRYVMLYHSALRSGTEPPL